MPSKIQPTSMSFVRWEALSDEDSMGYFHNEAPRLTRLLFERAFRSMILLFTTHLLLHSRYGFQLLGQAVHLARLNTLALPCSAQNEKETPHCVNGMPRGAQK